MDSQNTVISIKHLYKTYTDTVALRDICLNIASQKISGIVGPNGAGKTTLIRIISTLLKPSKGSVKINQQDILIDPNETRKIIGYLPEDASPYLSLTPLENLRFYSSFYPSVNISNDQLIAEYLKKFDLHDLKHKKAGKLSKGMKQKLLFIRSIIHNPDIIILDEPFNGMDPTIRLSIKKFLREKKNEGKTILFSSHNLLEVENLCDQIIILNKEILLNENINSIQRRYNKNIKSLEDLYLEILGKS
ncbi:ATP-binding cassette domain-containing protein [Candidatus Peregrinibacteria bacterium]|nr:ATP-binding cassette domain-containing protein [Candidatus Peregrinibacteria bacterium]